MEIVRTKDTGTLRRLKHETRSHRRRGTAAATDAGCGTK
jgi:hypothetical protein